MFVVAIIVLLLSGASCLVGWGLGMIHMLGRHDGSARRYPGGRIRFRVRGYLLFACFGAAGLGLGQWLRGESLASVMCLLALVPGWLGYIELDPARGVEKRRLFGQQVTSIRWSDVDHVVTTWKWNGISFIGPWSRCVVIVGRLPGQRIVLDPDYHEGQGDLLRELQRRKGFLVTVTEPPDRVAPGPGSNL